MVVGTLQVPAYCNGWVVSAKLVGTAMLPLVPVTVTVEFPMNVDALYAEVSVSVALPGAVTEAGEKVAATPAGSPLAVSATGPVNPYNAETFTT